MTESTPSVPNLIVVAEQEVYDLLAGCGASWDLQHRVDSIGQMWDDLSGGRLNQLSQAVIFSDSMFAAEGELEATVAVMAPAASTFLVVWNIDQVEGLLAGIREAAVQQGVDPEAPVYVLSPSSKRGLLDGIRDVFAASGVDAAWPGEYAVAVDGPLMVEPETEAAWEPETVEAAPAPVAPVAPVAPSVAPVAPVAQPVPPVTVAPVAPSVAPVAPAMPAPAYTSPVAPAMPAPGAVLAPGGQVDPLTQPQLPGQATFAVTSSKGGSGKSTTAMMLAAQIAASSKAAGTPKKVVLVDMDTRDGQVASLIGRYVPTALNIRVSPEWDQETILNNLVHDPKLGIDALLAPVRPRTADDVGPDFYRHVIRMLQRTHDVVIMDTSVNYLDPLISTVCLPESTAILFVTTLATTSVQGMARALREITEPVQNGGMGINRKKIGVVVNQSVTDVGMDKDQVLQAALKVSIVGAIPLATRDVLTATNFNRMHLLLKHPLLGPAYYRLASTCLPHTALNPLIEGEQAEGAAAQVGQPAPVAAVNGVAAAATAAPAPEQHKKRGLFGRKG